MKTMKFAESLGIAVALFCISSLAAAQAAPTVKSLTPVRQALNAFMKAPQSPAPAGTQVRGISIQNGLATVNFSRQLKDNFHGSDTAEIDVVSGILKTLGEFPAIRSVQILVEGKRVDSLGGLLEISSPLAIIRPDAAPRSAQVAALAP